MDYLKKNHLAILILVVLGGLGLFGGKSTGALGTLDTTTFTNPIVFSSDATFSGGDGAIVITTSNTATSSVEVGCIQTTATSTATPVKFLLGRATFATTTYSGVSSSGFVVWKFGTCP